MIIFLLFFTGVVASDSNEKFLLPMYHEKKTESSTSCCEHVLAVCLMGLHAMRFSPPDNIVNTSYQQSRAAINTVSSIDVLWILRSKRNRDVRKADLIIKKDL